MSNKTFLNFGEILHFAKRTIFQIEVTLCKFRMIYLGQKFAGTDMNDTMS